MGWFPLPKLNGAKKYVSFWPDVAWEGWLRCQSGRLPGRTRWGPERRGCCWVLLGEACGRNSVLGGPCEIPTKGQLISCVLLFVTAWIAACQASLSLTISWNLLKFMSIELVMLSVHLILCCPLLLCLQPLPTSRSFPVSWLFALGGQSSGASASASVIFYSIFYILFYIL